MKTYVFCKTVHSSITAKLNLFRVRASRSGTFCTLLIFSFIVTLMFGLAGTGRAQNPPVTISPTALTFSAQLIDTISTAQDVHLTNNQLVSLNISSISATGDFSKTTTCGNTLPPTSSCTITLNFVPTAVGARTGTLTIQHNAPGNPALVSLTGQGSQLIVGGVVSTSRMNYSRYGHTATLLQDGRVLIAGGSAGPAELYDPITNTFKITGYMTAFHQFHTATLLGDGRVLITGGDNEWGDAIASADLFDPVTETFSSAGSMTVARSGHTATLLLSGNVLLAGGVSNWQTGLVLRSTEQYNPASGAFRPFHNLASSRFYHTAVLLADGAVLFVGGENATVSGIRKAEIYSGDFGGIYSAGSTRVLRSGPTATLLKDGRALITQGCVGSGTNKSAELFLEDPWFKFVTTAATQRCDWGATAVLLPDGTVFVTELSFAELYNPDLGTFGSRVNFPGYGGPNATLLQNGLVLVTGLNPDVAVLYQPRFNSTISVTSSRNPSIYNSSVLFTITVSSSTTPTGNVILKDGTKTLATVALAGGGATVSKKLAAGAHSLTAFYVGDTVVGPSASSPLNQVIDQATTTTTLASSANPASSGQAVTFTATVNCATAAPQGTVTFKAGTTDLGTYALVKKQATVTTSTLPPGTTLITATYNGNANVLGSVGSITQTVN